MSIGDITSKELKLKKRKKKEKNQCSLPWNSKVSTFIYLKLMLSKSTSGISAKLILCLLLGLYLIVDFLWLGRILLFNSSFILEISDNWHHSSFSLTPLQNWSVWSRKKWAVHSGLCVYTFVHALLLCHNETANAEKMLNAQMTWNPPDSSVLVKQELLLWGHSVQQAGVRVLSNRQINKTEDHRLYLKWMYHDSAGVVLYDFSYTMFCFY